MMLDQTRQQLRCCTQLRPDFWPFPRDLWLGVTNWAVHRAHPYHALSCRQLVSRLQPATRRRVPTSYSPLSAMGGSGSKPTGAIQAQQTISAAVRCVAVVYWRCAQALCAGGPWLVLAANGCTHCCRSGRRACSAGRGCQGSGCCSNVSCNHARSRSTRRPRWAVGVREGE